MTFRELGLCAPILKALEEQGYEKPSPIQERAIPPALMGKDVLGLAQTGTGKTCAFGTPILQLLDSRFDESHPTRALILTPTRELAIQIGDSFTAYGKHLNLRHTVIFGGVGQNPQVEALRRGADILVATPGRLIDLYQQKLLDLSHIEIFVLDEADRMLDMGFIHDVKKILGFLPKKKQTMLFSATMPKEISDLVDSLLHDPAKVAVDPVSSPVDRIEQSVYFVDRNNKTRLLAHLVRTLNVKNALVFTRTKHGANKVAGDLMKEGITAAAIHGNKSQTARQQALADFKAGRVQVLVATDIAARGIDIEELSHVFNYNLPEVPETYVHRIGRTGRAGHGGKAVAFCDFSEKPLLSAIEKLMGRTVPVVEEHPYPMQNFEAVVKDSCGRVVNAEDAEARAAAKERRRQRDAANKAAAEARKATKAAKAAAPAEEPASKAPAPKKAKARKPEPKKAEQPTAPAPAAPQEHKSKKRPAVRHQRLEDTMPQRPSTASGDFYRPDPLASDHVMDATARLLAPRKSIFSAPEKEHREASRPNGNRTRSRRKKPANVQPPAPSKPEKAAKPAQKSAPSHTGKQTPPAKKGAQENRGSQRRSRAPQRPMEPYNRSHLKDSTEQPSLMKPYYIEHD